jgi:hypothetical protein
MRPVTVACDRQASARSLAALRRRALARTVIFATLLNFLFPLLTAVSITAFLLLPLSPLHDLVLAVATMIHSRIDHCITE